MVLFYVEADREYVQVRRCGRFSIEKDCAVSKVHRLAAIKEATAMMIEGLMKKGYEYAGGEFEIRGPLDHIEFSEDATVDPGPSAMPDPRDLQAMEEWERAERTRLARKMGYKGYLVDFELATNFKREVPRQFRAV